MVDVSAIPDRLEHAVGEAEHQNVLHRFLAEIMIDAINLMFFRRLQQLRIQFVAPKPDRRPNGFSTTIRRQRSPSCLRQVPSARVPWRSARRPRAASQDRTAVALRAPCLSLFFQLVTQALERALVLDIGADGHELFRNRLPRDLVVDVLRRKFAQLLMEARAQTFGRNIARARRPRSRRGLAADSRRRDCRARE